MDKQCEIIQDLLPLYADDICSEGSRKMVEDHIASCSECAGILKKLRSSEIEDALESDRSGVIEKQRRLFKRRSALVGTIFAGILMIPVIVCLIVNLAVGNGMEWFFVVLAAILLAASLIVVPLMVPGNKGLWTMTSGTAALILLLVVIGITYGNSAYWSALPLSVLPPLVYVWVMFLIIRYVRFSRLAAAGLCCIWTGAFLFCINNILGAAVGYDLPWPQFNPTVWNAYTVDWNVKWLCLLGGGAVGIILLIIGIIRGNRKR